MGQIIQQVWLNFLPIANVALAIVFLIVIYSTATGAGLSKYSVMKIMPRLIVVAIGINVSFYICAIFADLSNIFGDNAYNFIYDAMTKPLSRIVSSPYQEFFQNLTNGALSTVGLIALIVIAVLNIGAVLLAALTIIVAITARSIILTLLVIVSPLAFAAALLPNTQKWFNKWLDQYIRLLVIYPVFMGAWGAVRGIQAMIFENPDVLDFSHVLGLLLPIAPLFMIIPLFKAAGGLMGKMTGAVQSGINNSAFGKSMLQRDADRKTRMGARVQTVASNLRDVQARNAKFTKEDNDKLNDYKEARRLMDKQKTPGQSLTQDEKDRFKNITGKDIPSAGPGLDRMRGEYDDTIKTMEDNKKSKMSRARRFAARIGAGIGARIVEIPSGGRNLHNASEQMANLANTESYANFMNNKRRANQFGGKLAPFGLGKGYGRYAAAMQGQATMAKAELDERSVRGAGAIIADYITNATRKGIRTDDAIVMATTKFGHDVTMAKGLIQASVAQGTPGITKGINHILNSAHNSGNSSLVSAVNDEILKNSAVIEQKNIVAVAAAKRNTTYNVAFNDPRTYEEKPANLLNQPVDVLKQAQRLAPANIAAAKRAYLRNPGAYDNLNPDQIYFWDSV